MVVSGLERRFRQVSLLEGEMTCNKICRPPNMDESTYTATTINLGKVKASETESWGYIAMLRGLPLQIKQPKSLRIPYYPGRCTGIRKFITRTVRKIVSLRYHYTLSIKNIHFPPPCIIRLSPSTTSTTSALSLLGG